MSHDDRFRGQTAHDVWGDDLDAFDDDGYDDGAAPQPYADQRIEDSDAFVRSTNGYVGDAEALLRRILEIIVTAPTMPLSSSPRLDRDAPRLVGCRARFAACIAPSLDMARGHAAPRVRTRPLLAPP